MRVIQRIKTQLCYYSQKKDIAPKQAQYEVIDTLEQDLQSQMAQFPTDRKKQVKINDKYLREDIQQAKMQKIIRESYNKFLEDNYEQRTFLQIMKQKFKKDFSIAEQFFPDIKKYKDNKYETDDYKSYEHLAKQTTFSAIENFLIKEQNYFLSYLIASTNDIQLGKDFLRLQEQKLSFDNFVYDDIVIKHSQDEFLDIKFSQVNNLDYQKNDKNYQTLIDQNQISNYFLSFDDLYSYNISKHIKHHQVTNDNLDVFDICSKQQYLIMQFNFDDNYCTIIKDLKTDFFCEFYFQEQLDFCRIIHLEARVILVFQVKDSLLYEYIEINPTQFFQVSNPKETITSIVGFLQENEDNMLQNNIEQIKSQSSILFESRHDEEIEFKSFKENNYIVSEDKNKLQIIQIQENTFKQILSIEKQKQQYINYYVSENFIYFQTNDNCIYQQSLKDNKLESVLIFQSKNGNEINLIQNFKLALVIYELNQQENILSVSVYQEKTKNITNIKFDNVLKVENLNSESYYQKLSNFQIYQTNGEVYDIDFDYQTNNFTKKLRKKSFMQEIISERQFGFQIQILKAKNYREQKQLIHFSEEKRQYDYYDDELLRKQFQLIFAQMQNTECLKLKQFFEKYMLSKNNVLIIENLFILKFLIDNQEFLKNISHLILKDFQINQNCFLQNGLDQLPDDILSEDIKVLFINPLMNSETSYSRVLMNELRRKNKNKNIFYIEISQDFDDLYFMYINNFIKQQCQLIFLNKIKYAKLLKNIYKKICVIIFYQRQTD